MSLRYSVVHRTYNRIRIRVPALSIFSFLERPIKECFTQQKGVKDVRVNQSCCSVVVTFDPKVSRPNLIQLGLLTTDPDAYHYDDTDNAIPVVAPMDENDDSKKTLIISSVALAVAAILPTHPFILAPLTLWSSLPIIKRSINCVLQERRVSVDVLDAVAIITMLLRRSPLPAAFMSWLIAVGDYIRDRTIEKTRKAVTDLLNFKKQKAWVLRDNKKKRLPIDELVEGDVVIAYTGNMIAVDGAVMSGKALVDQKTLTGESVPVEKKTGGKVFASTLVCEGKLYIKAESVGDSTRAAAIVQIVENAPKHETRLANYARVFADKIAGPTLALAAGIYGFTKNINLATSLVILDFGTGMRVAAPTAAISSIAAAARKGILIKGGAQLEKMSQIDTLIFDKTGTLTIGSPAVTDVHRFNGFSEDEVLMFAAAAEARVTHPVAKAICKAAKERGLIIPERQESEYKIGLGVKVFVNGYCVHAGSSRYFEQENINCAQAHDILYNNNDSSKAPIFVAVNNELVGTVMYHDPPRTEALHVIRELKRRKIKVVMLSGDTPGVASSVAKLLDIDDYVAEVFPEQKAKIVQEYQRNGHVVGMIGDGINDSPALALSDVGFSVRNGAEVSREVADVVLLQDDLGLLLDAIDISHNAMDIIKQDFNLIAIPNFIALGLALMGKLNPIAATIINNGTTVAAVLNSITPMLSLTQPSNQSGKSMLRYNTHNHPENFLANRRTNFSKQLCVI